MPNKYSHAVVLSNYEAHGLTQFTGNRIPEPQLIRRVHPFSESSGTGPVIPTSQTDATAPHPKPKPGPIAIAARHRPQSPRRLLLDSPSPPLPPPRVEAAPRLPKHQHADSVATQIWAPEDNVIAHGPAKRESWQGKKSQKGHSSTPRPESASWSLRIAGGDVEKTSSSARARDYAGSARAVDDRLWVGLEGHDSRGLQHPRSRKTVPRKLSNETEIYAPEASSSAPPLLTSHRSSIEPQASQYLDRSPPSPPLTPETRHSFSLETCFDQIQAQSVPAVPERATRHSPPSRSTEDAPVNQMPGPTTPPTSGSSGAENGRTESKAVTAPMPPVISTRTSSLRATTFPQFDSTSPSSRPGSIQSNSIRSTSISHRTAGGHTRNFSAFSSGSATSPSTFPADIELFSNTPLPELEPVDLLRWGNSRFDNDEPGDLAESAVSSRSSSFDSAAPPPIGRSKASKIHPDRARPSSRRTEDARASEPTQPHLSTAPPVRVAPIATGMKGSFKKSRRSFSSFFRSSMPRSGSVFKNTTVPQKSPDSVSISGTNAPSIPNSLPKHIGQWSPTDQIWDYSSSTPSAAPPEMQSRKHASSSRGSASIASVNEQRMNGETASTTYTGIPSKAEKRRSWFRNGRT